MNTVWSPLGKGSPRAAPPPSRLPRPPARDEDAAMTSTPYTVNDVMTKKVIAFSPDAGFKEIATAMERWKVSAAPVVEGEGHVVGVVSEADLLPKEEFHDHRPGMIEQTRHLGDTAKAGSLRAEELMTTPAITIHPDATLPQAARLMAERHVKRAPGRRRGRQPEGHRQPRRPPQGLPAL